MPVWFTRTLETEWNGAVRLKPLAEYLNNKREFIEQIKIRIPPKPIRASEETESEFDEGSRIKPQIANIFSHLKRGAARIRQTGRDNRTNL